MDSIEPLHLFSYRDDAGFIYGFDVRSIIELCVSCKNNSRVINPYNRESLPHPVINGAKQLYRVIPILFPHSPGYKSLSIPTGETTNNRLHAINQRLAAFRELHIQTRFRNICAEIDVLGNYTDSNWFISMYKIQYAKFYKDFYEWWTTYSRIPLRIRRRICVFDDPFDHLHLLHQYSETTVFEFQEACLDIIEKMIFTGVDIEHRRLGAMHVLTILTLVSRPARAAMPWLYDNILQLTIVRG